MRLPAGAGAGAWALAFAQMHRSASMGSLKLRMLKGSMVAFAVLHCQEER